MLGIRQWQNVSIDLWMGDYSKFFCDELIVLDAQLVTNEAVLALGISAKEEIWEALKVSLGRSRHIAFFTAIQRPIEVLPLIFHFLKEWKAPTRKRVTLLFSDLKNYDEAQKLLFSEIPELVVENQ